MKKLTLFAVLILMTLTACAGGAGTGESSGAGASSSEGAGNFSVPSQALNPGAALPEGVEYPAGVLPYEKLPDDYTLEQAKADGCVTFEDIDITSGQEVWDAFVASSKEGRPSFVRLAYYYTLGDPSGYDPSYYEEIKNDYPMLFIQDLTYDGEQYRLYSVEKGKERIQEYKFLLRYLDVANPEATYTECDTYVLINEDTYSWEELRFSRYSSSWEDHIDYRPVYWKHVYKEGWPE